jgi:hypothetical protein
MILELYIHNMRSRLIVMLPQNKCFYFFWAILMCFLKLFLNQNLIILHFKLNFINIYITSNVTSLSYVTKRMMWLLKLLLGL